MLISQIGLLEPIQNQDHGIIPGCPRNPYRFIHTKCPLSRLSLFQLQEWIWTRELTDPEPGGIDLGGQNRRFVSAPIE